MNLRSLSVGTLVATGVLSGTRLPLRRAAALATASRDRQVVALAQAEGGERFDALVRDHLATYPDHLLASWIATRPPSLLRWLLSFAGFPLGGLAAMVLVGPVDSPGAALAGGLLTGAVLGAVQAWALRSSRSTATAWVAATALGLGAGLALGSALVDYRTSLGALALQGAVSGALVGLAQAVVLRRRAAYLWPPYLAAVWALGWTVTTAIGVQVEDRFTVFGSAGAVTVAVLTSILPILMHRDRKELP